MIVELRERDVRHPDLTPGQPYVVLGIGVLIVSTAAILIRLAHAQGVAPQSAPGR